MPRFPSLVAVIASALGTPEAHADEYYEFFAIRCAPSANFMSIDSVGIYNIGEIVWPPAAAPAGEPSRDAQMAAHWRAHEEGLKTLEAEGLYVFDQLYGRYDPQPTKCTTSEYSVSLSAEPVEREFVNESDIKVQYRGPLRVRIQLPDGRVVWDHILPQHDSLRIDRDEITICKGEPYRPTSTQHSECARAPLRPR